MVFLIVDAESPSLQTTRPRSAEFEDGTVVLYDTKAKVLFLNCVQDIKVVAGGKIEIKCPSVSIEGNVNVIGNLKVSGTIEDAKGDLTSHNHPDASVKASHVPSRHCRVN